MGLSLGECFLVKQTGVLIVSFCRVCGSVRSFSKEKDLNFGIGLDGETI